MKNLGKFIFFSEKLKNKSPKVICKENKKAINEVNKYK